MIIEKIGYNNKKVESTKKYLYSDNLLKKEIEYDQNDIAKIQSDYFYNSNRTIDKIIEINKYLNRIATVYYFYY